MIYLIGAISCNLIISILMKKRREFVKNEMAMFMANYIVCTILSKYYTGAISFASDTHFCFALGVISGFMYLTSFVLSDKSIEKNGIVMSTTFGKLGVLVPTAMAILVFHEGLSLIQGLGFFLAILSIFLIYFDKSGISQITSKSLLVSYMLLSGFTDSTISIYDKIGVAAYKDQFLLVNFFFALVFTIIAVIMKKQKFTWKDCLWGFLLGFPNYFSSRFLMCSLASVPAVLAYPIFSIGSVSSITLCGMLLFKEKLSARKIFAIGVVVVALVLLNL